MIDVVRAADISGRDLTDYHDSRMVAQLEMELSVMREGFIIKLDLVEKYRHDCKMYIKHMDLMEAKQVEIAGLIADLESSLQIEKEMSDSLHSQVGELNATISDEVMVRDEWKKGSKAWHKECVDLIKTSESLKKQLADEEANHLHNIKAAGDELDKVKGKCKEETRSARQYMIESNLHFKQKGHLEALLNDILPLIEGSNIPKDVKVGIVGRIKGESQ